MEFVKWAIFLKYLDHILICNLLSTTISFEMDSFPKRSIQNTKPNFFMKCTAHLRKGKSKGSTRHWNTNSIFRYISLSHSMSSVSQEYISEYVKQVLEGDPDKDKTFVQILNLLPDREKAKIHFQNLFKNNDKRILKLLLSSCGLRTTEQVSSFRSKFLKCMDEIGISSCEKGVGDFCGTKIVNRGFH